MAASDPVALGSVCALNAVFIGNTVPLTYEITEFDLPNRLVLTAENPSVRSTDAITFTADAPAAR